MKPLGKISDPRLAQAFVDYMAVKGVQCELTEQESHYLVLVADSDKFELALEAFKQFAQEPNHPRYRSASWERKDKSKAHFEYGNSGTPLLHQIWLHAGPVTLIVLAVCLLIGLLSQVGLARDIYDLLHFPVTSAGQWGEVWRLFTPALMHVALIHLIFNLVWWWYLGGRIEHEVGSIKLIELLFAGALISNVLQGVVVGPNFLGLSGVVYTLLGYIAVVQRVRPALALPQAYIGFMLLWLILGFVGVLGEQIANFAHLGGLLVGVGQGWLDSKKATK